MMIWNWQTEQYEREPYTIQDIIDLEKRHGALLDRWDELTPEQKEQLTAIDARLEALVAEMDRILAERGE